MKKIYLLAVLCVTLFLNTSCESNDSEDTPKISGSLSVEEGKTQLEDNTIELLNKIESFKNDNALNDIIELAEYLNADSGVKNKSFKNTSLKTISNIANLETTVNGLTVFNAKQAVVIIAETSLIDDFNNEKGIYTWNANTEGFDKTGDSDDIIYNVAYNDGKNAVFSITDFSTTLAGSNNDEELPTLAKANLKLNGTTVFSQNYTATFKNGQLIPTTINNTTSIGDFSFVTTYTNSNNKEIGQALSFNLGNDVIMGYNLATNGNFNDELDGNIEDIVDNVTYSFHFLNATLTLQANDAGFDSDSELSIDQQLVLLNSNTSAELSINNKSIAKSQFYKDEDTYTDYIYNPNTQNYDETEVTEEVVNARFLFEDGSTNDFDTYFDGSFTSIEDKFDTVFDAYESLLGDI
ncbi:hypothetical protein MPF19_16960 [Polaribacter sp. Z014]|uniref:hypothetical protein n=1 Tax=Polaribacter sp. Z014 TaxID=2927126 RepID=UPI002020581E|nr:hypothetical protein [Polaribacter sp. Z014]MCL7765117.1 hypothetical protein [Polaribacter sp. Z014]